MLALFCFALLCFTLLYFTLLYFTLLYFTLKSNLISPHQELYFQIKALIMQTEDYGRHEGNEPGRILLRPGFTYYSDVIMRVLASQISGVSIVYWTVGRSTKTSKPHVTAFVRGIHRWPVNSRHKWPVTRKMFPFDDVIMLRWKWLSSSRVIW